MKTYKILLFNMGYFSGLDGSTFNYIFKAHRYFFPSKNVIDKVSNGFNKIILTENPDIICLVEVRKKQIKYLFNKVNKQYKFSDFETKYVSNGLSEVLPVLKNYCNGFISKEKTDFKKFFIKNGFKKLMYEIKIYGKIKILFFHFALGKEVRTKQFLEIKKIIEKYDHNNTIICGDFNIFNGTLELNRLLENSNLQLCHKIPTFPAHNPKKAIDLFIASKNLIVKSKIIKSDISDHLPVLLEVSI